MWKNRDSTLFCFINESKQYHFVTKREIYIYIYIYIREREKYKDKIRIFFPFFEETKYDFFFLSKFTIKRYIKILD